MRPMCQWPVNGPVSPVNQPQPVGDLWRPEVLFCQAFCLKVYCIVLWEYLEADLLLPLLCIWYHSASVLDLAGCDGVSCLKRSVTFESAMTLTHSKDTNECDRSILTTIRTVFDILSSSRDPKALLGNLAIKLGFVEQNPRAHAGRFETYDQEINSLICLLDEEYACREDWLSQWWYPQVFKDLAGLIFDCTPYLIHFPSSCDSILPYSILCNHLVGIIPKLRGCVDYDTDWELLCWFWQAPDVELLKVISLYLEISKDEETFSRSRYSDVVVVSVSYEVAATILEARVCKETGLEAVVSWIQDGVQENPGYPEDEKINLLIKLPETCSALRAENLLHYSNFVPLVTSHLIGRISSCDPAGPKLRLCSTILDKLSSRGFSRWVAHTLMDVYLSDDEAVPKGLVSSILRLFPETGEGIKLVVGELLYQISELDKLGSAAQKALVMRGIISRDVWDGHVGVRLQLGDTLLTKGRLHENSLQVLLNYLKSISSDKSNDSALALAFKRVVAVWSGPSSTNNLSAHQQKILANFIIGCLGFYNRDTLEKMGDIIPQILKGISVYLESPREPLRHLGMCVGNSLSSTLTPEKPLIFSEKGIESSISLNGSTMEVKDDQELINEKRVVVEGNDVNSNIDSDDDTIDSEFGAQQDLDDSNQEDIPIKLEEMVKMLRNGENNWKEQLAAIAVAEDVIKASPCELGLYAKDITQALMYARIPAWTNEEREKRGTKPVDEQRLDALLALILEEPRDVGSYLIDAFYSPSSDIQHRVRALQLLSTGAKCLQSERPLQEIEAGPECRDPLKQRWAGQAGHILLEWSSKLLLQCDKRQQGIDLFGKDTHLLGCFICTLGNFVNVCSGSHEALYLGTAILRLINSDSVKNSEEIFVRRSALAAGAQSIASVPASSVSAAFAQSLIGTADDALEPRQDASVASIEFFRLTNETNEWFQSVSENDIDSTCRKLGAGGVAFIGNLAMDALEEYSKLHQDNFGTMEWKDDLRLKYRMSSPRQLRLDTVKIPKISEIGI